MIPKKLWWLYACTGVAQLVDIVSSFGFPKGSGFHETNGFARYPDGTFRLSHALGNKAVNLLLFGLLSWGIYLALKDWDEKKAASIATAPLLYFAFEALTAAVNNVQLHLGWYAPYIQGD